MGERAARRSSQLDMDRFHHSGTRPVKALLIGDRRQVLAPSGGSTLAERAADRIWLTTRRGVDLDVLVDLAPVLRAVQGVFKTWRLWRYDVVVVVLGDGLDARQRPRTVGRVADLLAEVLADAAGATDVVLAAPDLGRHDPSGRLRDAVAALASDRVRYLPIAVEADASAGPRHWAAAIADAVRASLDRQRLAPAGTTATALRDVVDDEAERQDALDALQVVGAPREPRLDDLVELARTAFGTESAEINFIDHDRQWKMAVAGGLRGENPRAHSFCNLTVRLPEPTVIPDARLDPVLRSNPMVTGPHPVRFYAAHPIESVAGYRIGSFCVYDSEPRDVRGLDLSVLRDLALLAQAEIVAHDTVPAGVAPGLAAAFR